MNRVVFIDRDGVIKRKAPEGRYICNWSEMELLPGAIDAIAHLNSVGFRVFVVSNQRGVARGMVQESDLQEIHRRLLKTVSQGGGEISGIYYCPHDYSNKCKCRKPSPGMLLQAVREHDLVVDGCWMIGDSESDIEAGRRVGCRTVRILQSQKKAITSADACAPDLKTAANFILSTL
jgi:D-glycero-D-manno-heptose 1,7-bisphosphate phosphatase